MNSKNGCPEGQVGSPGEFLLSLTLAGAGYRIAREEISAQLTSSMMIMSNLFRFGLRLSYALLMGMIHAGTAVWHLTIRFLA